MKKGSKGVLFVISAPSGTGKTTICRTVVASDRRIRESVSFTTRAPRTGEKNNRDYTFVSREDFLKSVRRGEFVEWAEVHGNLYGTSKRRLRELMAAGYDIILDIDTQGAGQFRKVFPEGVFIFIMPPSLKALEDRLHGRGANSPEDRGRRLRNARREIKSYKKYDYVIVNDKLDDAIAALRAVISAERLRTNRLAGSWIKDNFFA